MAGGHVAEVFRSGSECVDESLFRMMSMPRLKRQERAIGWPPCAPLQRRASWTTLIPLRTVPEEQFAKGAPPQGFEVSGKRNLARSSSFPDRVAFVPRPSRVWRLQPGGRSIVR